MRLEAARSRALATTGNGNPRRAIGWLQPARAMGRTSLALQGIREGLGLNMAFPPLSTGAHPERPGLTDG